ncbi:MAG: zinc-ribbon domain-containing protein, partial [Candidatus Magnetomorum sp.]|nr:zinc-ribbon domain-containing protein [Candidatus Magnetomorum sp.]
MKFKCTNCNTTFKVKDGIIPDAGGTIRCKVCKHVFKVYPHESKEKKAQTPENVAKKEDDGLPIIIYTPDKIKQNQIQKLLQHSQLSAIFYDDYKQAQQFFIKTGPHLTDDEVPDSDEKDVSFSSSQPEPEPFIEPPVEQNRRQQVREKIFIHSDM